MSRYRKTPRYKKTAFFIAGLGVASGLAAVVLWPHIKRWLQKPSITMLPPTITQKS